MRRATVAVVTAVFAASAAAGATAAGAKAKPTKPKLLKGSYTLSLPPDPTMEATGAAGMECKNVDPLSADNHNLALPGTGTLDVVLDSPDPTGQGKTDWDLYLLDAAGDVLASSHGPTSHEEVLYPGLPKGKVVIRSCNLLGEPSATVTYRFVYR